MKIDLNCDLGESAGSDEDIMPHITSANIACGSHAGDADIMQVTVRLAKRYGVNIGAHPGWNDRENFGRREMNVPAQEVEALVFEQISLLVRIAGGEGLALTHVKPHGSLYNQAAVDRGLADAIARAVKRSGSGLILVGLAGSELCAAGTAAGIRVAGEGFPDRAYAPDGTLMPRTQPGAVIGSPQEVARNAVKLAGAGIMFGGKRIRLDTLCLHGDNERAVENAILLRAELVRNGIGITPLGGTSPAAAGINSPR